MPRVTLACDLNYWQGEGADRVLVRAKPGDVAEVSQEDLGRMPWIAAGGKGARSIEPVEDSRPIAQPLDVGGIMAAKTPEPPTPVPEPQPKPDKAEDEPIEDTQEQPKTEPEPEAAPAPKPKRKRGRPRKTAP